MQTPFHPLYIQSSDSPLCSKSSPQTQSYISERMSSPASRRSNRNRQSATPVRSLSGNNALGGSTQPPSPNQENAPQEPRVQMTPRASRQVAPASSPLFYGSSSPANGGNRPVNMEPTDVSSPLRQTSFADRDSTPRPRAPPLGGESITSTLLTQSDDHNSRLVASTICLKLKPRPRSE